MEIIALKETFKGFEKNCKGALNQEHEVSRVIQVLNYLSVGRRLGMSSDGEADL